MRPLYCSIPPLFNPAKKDKKIEIAVIGFKMDLTNVHIVLDRQTSTVLTPFRTDTITITEKCILNCGYWF